MTMRRHAAPASVTVRWLPTPGKLPVYNIFLESTFVICDSQTLGRFVLLSVTRLLLLFELPGKPFAKCLRIGFPFRCKGRPESLGCDLQVTPPVFQNHFA